MRRSRLTLTILLPVLLAGCAVDFSKMHPWPSIFGPPMDSLRQQIIETAMAAAPRFSGYQPTVEQWENGGFDSEGHPIISENTIFWLVRLRPQGQPVKEATLRRVTSCCMTLPMTPSPVDGEVVVVLSGGFRALGIYRFK